MITMMRSAFLLAIVLYSSISAYGKDRIAVIGAGIAGTSAALMLSENSQNEVHLYEKESIVGGNAKTVLFPNSYGVPTPIDFGPQFFAEGAWDTYIDFLGQYGLYSQDDIFKFNASIAISYEEQRKPQLVSPILKSIRITPKNIAGLLALKKFIKESRHFFLTQKDRDDISVEDFLETLDIKQKYKERVVLPFLSSILGTEVHQTLSMAMLSLTQLYAFRKPHPLGITPFLVSKVGMGVWIQKMAEMVSNRPNGDVYRSSPVQSVTYNPETQTYYVKSTQKEVKEYDAVLIATHPDTAAKILSDQDEELYKDLLSLPYIDSRVVIHRDQNTHLVHKKYDHHTYSIRISEAGKTPRLRTTINLSNIDEDFYAGIYRSIVMEDDVLESIQGEKMVMMFHHPLVTPYFLQTVKKIKEKMRLKHYSSLGERFSLIGGWLELSETQNTAIESAKQGIKVINPQI